jgi:O-antigen/teichoic acid export membrane protein
MNNQNITERLLTGAFLRALVLFCNVAVSFYLMPLIVRSLGDRFYGLWSLIGFLIGYYGLLDLGISSAVARFISRAFGTKDRNEILYVANTAITFFFIMGIIGAVLSVFASYLSPLFFEARNEIYTFRILVLIMGITTAVSFPMRAIYGLLVARLRYDYFSYIELSQLFLRAALIYYFLNAGYGIITLALITALTQMCGHFLRALLAFKEYPYLKVSLSFFSFTHLRQLFDYGIFSSLSRIANQLRFKVDSYVIVAFANLSLVTHYEIGARLIEYFYLIIKSIVNILMPVFSRYEGENDYDSIRKYFEFTTLISTILATYLGFSLIVFGKAFIQRWMGTSYLDSYYIASILAIGATIDSMQNPMRALLYGLSKHKFYSFVNISEGVTNLALSVTLMGLYNIKGVAIATTIEIIIFRLIVLPFYVCKSINISLRRYYLEILGFTTVKMLLFLVPFAFVVRAFLKPTYFSFFALATIQTILIIPVSIYWVLGVDNRNLLLQNLTPIIRKFRIVPS